ncbi:polysaccharide deacetylase family protein [Massilia sp. CF038]|uniref:polysaccharide deacetylase family protein n=1 Tax=Massilia sp. CF038 TaxID=1881045 RepID=UPI0009234597|nr:polysaccharide deacetylase family protein [Massilia sp. CF038]SHG74856.1 Polysaccharide deacetylase [Massilia sp. CF038]
MQLPLPILLYRRIVTLPALLHPGALQVQHFERQIRWLQQWCRLLPVSVAVRQLQERTLPARAIALTFEDVCADHLHLALPVLQRHGVPAAFFVSSGLLDGQPSWRDNIIALVRQAAGPRLCLARAGFGSFDIGCLRRRCAVIALLLDALSSLPAAERRRRMAAVPQSDTGGGLHPDHLLALHRAGMEIGACAISEHPLTRLSNAEARAEIATSRAQLEDIVQAPVTLFSYPNGMPGNDFERRHGNMLRAAGFAAAVTTAQAAAHCGSDVFALPRVTLGKRAGPGLCLPLTRHWLSCAGPAMPMAN